MDGRLLGCEVGLSVGLQVFVGAFELTVVVGFADIVGLAVGKLEGKLLGLPMGVSVRRIVGPAVVGTGVGLCVGAHDGDDEITELVYSPRTAVVTKVDRATVG